MFCFCCFAVLETKTKPRAWNSAISQPRTRFFKESKDTEIQLGDGAPAYRVQGPAGPGRVYEREKGRSVALDAASF